MAIRQVNAGYVAAEDRILLRVTLTEGDELRFWLTRASLRAFVGQAAAWLAATDGSPAAAMQAFKREAAAAQADFATPLQQGETFPLGKLPILVEDLRLESEGATARLLLRLLDKRAVTLHLDEKALAGIQHLLRQAVAAADWGLVVAAPATLAASARLH